MTTSELVVAIGLSTAMCLGCSSEAEDSDPFSFGGPEMNAAAGGDWVGSLALAGMAETNYQLHLDHAPPQRPACDSRTLTEPACITMSSMGFVGTLSSDDLKFDQTPVTATFQVMGTELHHGDLTIVASELVLSANYDGGMFVNCRVLENDAETGTFTMHRP